MLVLALGFISNPDKHQTGPLKTPFLFPYTTGPSLLLEPKALRVFALLQPDNLTLGFPTSKCSVWAALLS